MRHHKIGATLILAAGALVLFLNCGVENPLQPARGNNEVWIQASGFDPATLTVPAGATVVWTNKDNAIHDVTSGTPMNPGTDFTPSPPLKANETYSVRFTQARQYPYYCTVHQNSGTIVVQ